MATTTKARARQEACRPLKSPLATPAGAGLSLCPPAPGTDRPSTRQALSERHETLAEFADYLRTITNRDGRPYEEATINAYVSPVKHLDAWMTANAIDGDFCAADAAMLNRYFREYYQEHGQGGTHTHQRNLIQLSTTCRRNAAIRAHTGPGSIATPR
jgi:hypothetical protein